MREEKKVSISRMCIQLAESKDTQTHMTRWKLIDSRCELIKLSIGRWFTFGRTDPQPYGHKRIMKMKRHTIGVKIHGCPSHNQNNIHVPERACVCVSVTNITNFRLGITEHKTNER